MSHHREKGLLGILISTFYLNEQIESNTLTCLRFDIIYAVSFKGIVKQGESHQSDISFYFKDTLNERELPLFQKNQEYISTAHRSMFPLFSLRVHAAVYQ